MNPLRAYQEEQGRTDEEMATDLSALLGRRISAQGYRLHSNKAKAPKAWADALDLPIADTDPGVWEDTPPTGDEPATREPGATPTAPLGARTVTPSVGGNYGFAKDRIEKAYNAIGAGASMVTRNDGYAAVTKHNAPAIADAWVAAAKENEHVAAIVRFMESGGPVGELVVCHILLVFGFVYVSGKGPDALDAIYGSHFSGYRAAAIGGRIADDAARVANNGSAPQGAESPVGDTQS